MSPFYETRPLTRSQEACKVVIVVRLLAISILAGPLLHAQLVQVRHWTGQSVSPVYEGYDTNADGSFNMWFGYLNRNYEEEPDIAVGADNQFSPGNPDRGQPTHFKIRRRKDVFSVTVPKDFGDQKLTWTLNINGQRQEVSGTLNPVWMIDHRYTTRGANIENPYSNLPPVVTVEPSSRTAAVSAPVTLSVWATDDGRPKRRGQPVGMTFDWAKYRGPGNVVFAPATAKLDDAASSDPARVAAKGSTVATFGEPGEYVLQVVVDDGSGETAGNFGYHCCWTNVEVKITVK
jgi:hypothetical protein